MPPPLLAADELCVWYGRAQILFGVTLSVWPGEVVALMGRNGAGKSTTIKALMGLIPSCTGTRRFVGTDVGDSPSHAICRLGLGYVPEDRRIFTGLSVMENLEVGRQPPRAGLTPWTPERLFDLFPNLARMRDRPGGRMSGGEQQMLTIARTLMGNPLLLMMDEPSEGLAPVIVEDMARTVLTLKREGLAVLLSEQNLFFAREVSDRAYVIEHGRIQYEGSMASLAENEAVRHAYLTV